MTQIQQGTVKKFKKAFDCNDMSDVEIVAYCRNMKREKKQVDRSMEKRVRLFSRFN